MPYYLLVPQIIVLQTLRESRSLTEQKGRDEVPSDSQKTVY